MLTRYRQLYNRLTHSQAFKEEGPMDNSKINKKTFTPHNLKAILLGVNGAITVHYTTNDTDKKLVYPFSFQNGNGTERGPSEKWIVQNFNESKGLIDALWMGLHFNYVEEIVLFLGGFSEMERKLEIERVNKFIAKVRSNGNDKLVMRRLKGIVVYDGYLNNIQLDGTKPVLKQLKDMQVLCENAEDARYVVRAVFTPEKTELGLLLNMDLNGKDYELDSKYDENLPDNEKNGVKYRLSKHFYDETKRAEQARKDKVEAEKKAALQIQDDEMKEFLQELWEDVKPIYTDLYRNSVENGLIGILVPTGCIAYNKEKGLYTNNNVWVRSLTESIIRANGKGFEFNETQKLNSLQLSDLEEFNYFSQFHATNAFGIIREGERSRDWEKVLPVIEKRFKALARTFLSQADKTNITDLYGTIQKKLTNCIVLERFDRSSIISMKYKMEGLDSSYSKYFEDNCFNITKRESCKVLNDEVTQNNVASLFAVFDAKKFAAEALFSYQAYDDLIKVGKKPSLQNTVVGRNLDGSKNIFNLRSNDTRLTAMFAGSGSGKGVMTLGILSSVVANKVPFIYLDYKPDMAEMLWNIEKDFKARGITRTDGSECRILAIDAKADMTECSPVRGHRFGENLPDYMSEIPSTVFAVLPYLKLMQLYYLLADTRKNIINSKSGNLADYGGFMTYAIFDELQQNAIDNLSNLTSTLDGFEKAAKKAKNPNQADIVKYNARIFDFISKLANATGTFVNTDGRVANSRALYIGQNADYNKWVGKDDKSIQANLYQKTSFRFFGRNGGTGSYAPTNTGTIKEFVNNPDTFGYWTSAVGAGKVEAIKDWSVFKAYSVLNENDFNIDDPSASGRCTGGVLGNIQDEDVKNDLIENVFVIKDAQGNKTIRPEVGFLGLIQKLSGFSENELADALSEGYEVIWRIMCKHGMNNIYPDVESYLFDASLESIYTTDEIKRGITGAADTQQANKPMNDVSVFGSASDIYMDDDDVLEDLTTPSTISSVNESSPQPIPIPMPTPMNLENDGRTDYEPAKAQPQKAEEHNHQQPQRTQSQQAQGQQQYSNGRNSTQSWAEQRRQETMKEWPCYTGKIKIDRNPFEVYKTGTNTGDLLIVKDMTRILMEDIEKNVAPPSMITVFAISRGNLFFNGIAYIPQFDESFIQSLPFALQEKVRAGILSDFFDLRAVYKYKNLNEFYLIDWNLAQGRARKEMGIGFRKRWSVLFKKFKYLNYIEIGQGENTITYNRDNPDSPVEDKVLDMFSKKPETTYSRKGAGHGLLERVWDSRPVRVVTGAIGWTAGVQVVWALASIMGPWGLLFGALAAAGAYNEIKNNNNRTQGQRISNSSDNGFSATYDSKSSKKKKK